MSKLLFAVKHQHEGDEEPRTDISVEYNDDGMVIINHTNAQVVDMNPTEAAELLKLIDCVRYRISIDNPVFKMNINSGYPQNLTE